ncbi:MAG: hypothetical protein AAGK14_03770 [Verrucomicrobiota bacterium]
MTFRDVPTLAKFEKYARQHADCEITIDAYRRIRELITPVRKPADVMDPAQGMMQVDGLKESCQAIEKSTRVIWACAAATNQITPPLWDYTPEYQGCLQYFTHLEDLELMAITKAHRLLWEQPAAAT